jgi:cytochrome c-type biogenesis protein CcsB
MYFLKDYDIPPIACFFLFFAMIGYWISLIIPKEKKIFKISNYLVIFSNFLFILTLSIRWINSGYFPLSNLYESLLFLCWGICTIHLFLEKKTESRLIGSISTPLVFFLSSFSSLTLPIDMQKAMPLVPSLQSNWLMMHVSMMMVSYATLLLGSLLSIFYIAFEFFQNYKKSKEVFEERKEISEKTIFLKTTKYTLLTTIDSWSYRIIGLGFPFLTLGIISGAVWANEAWGSYWSWDPKETWALITWLIFASYLHSRLLKGWKGKKAAFIGSVGFFVIWICYLGVNFLGKGLHSYGWILNSFQILLNN